MLAELYNSTPYESLYPEVNPSATTKAFKFNSPTHYISWVRHLAEHHKRGSSRESSDDNDYPFSLSHSLKDAFDILDKTKFDKEDTVMLDTNVSKLKRRTRYCEDGYELDVPEYIAGSDRVWLEDTNKKTRHRIIDDLLMVEFNYNSHTNAEEARKAGVQLLAGIYKRNVIPRKMVMVCNVKSLTDSHEGDGIVFVDVSFSDLNGMAKILHPSAFRRLWFRIAEIYPSLRGGYGSSVHSDVSKGLIAIGNYAGRQPLTDNVIKQFLGV